MPNAEPDDIWVMHKMKTTYCNSSTYTKGGRGGDHEMQTRQLLDNARPRQNPKIED